MKKENRVLKIVSIVVALVFLVSAITCIGMVLSMNVLPAKYLQLMLGILIPVILIVFGLLLLRKTPKVIKVVAIILAVMLITGFCVGINYLYNTFEFMGSISSKDHEIENYYVIVKKDSKYESLEDLDKQSMGIVVEDNKNFTNVTLDIHSKVEVVDKEYNDSVAMTKDLLNGQIESSLISNAQYEVLKESDDTFESKVKIIYTKSIKTLTQDIKKDADVTAEPFNIYISGIDTFGNISTRSRSDVNIVMTVNPSTKRILLTTIPRDYYVKLHGTTGYKDKLTHAGVYGIDMSVKTIEDLLKIDINYYIRVNFNTLIDVVDVIGGVDVYSEKDFATWGNPDIKFKKGLNHLDGKNALIFSRERKTFAEGDRQRGKNQQAVITAIINKVTQSKTLVTKYNQILNSLDGSFQTNLPTNKIYSLIKLQLNDKPKWNVESISLDGSGKREYTYSYRGQKLYVMEPDQATVINAQSKIKQIESINQEN